MHLDSIFHPVDLYRRYRSNGLLAQFSRLAGQFESPVEVYLEMDSVLSKLLDYDRITIRFVEADGICFRESFVSGVSVEGFSQDSTSLLSGTVIEEVIASGEPLIIPDCGDESILARFQNLENSARQLPSLLAVPLIYRGTAVGTFQLRSRHKNAFSTGHAEMLQTAAAHITPTAVNTNQLAQLQREVRERTILAEIGRAASATIDFGEVWNQLVTTVESLTECDRLVVTLIDEDSGLLTNRYVYGIRLPGWDDNPTHSGDGTLSQRAIVLRHAEISSMEVSDEFSSLVVGYKLSERTGLRSAMFAPLIAADRVIGSLNVRSIKPDAYSAQDLAMFERLAMQVGGSIGSAELYSRTVRLAAEKDALAQLELENEKLTETNRTKSRFISTMSHELRTPLTSILAFTDIIRRDKSKSLSEKNQKHLDVIKRNGLRLKEMIDDLLELSNIQMHDLHVGRSEFTLQDSLTRLVSSMQPMIESKLQKLVTVFPEEEIKLVSDRDRIDQILSNLVSNACKYSSEYSEIRVEATVRDGSVHIAVTDFGDGIDQGEFAAMFDEFSRLDNEVTRATLGSGLGLAISRKLARALGGDIEVASTKGEGSVFTLTVPVELPMGQTTDTSLAA